MGVISPAGAWTERPGRHDGEEGDEQAEAEEPGEFGGGRVIHNRRHRLKSASYLIDGKSTVVPSI